MKTEIIKILDKADNDNTHVPPTLLYNEGWMLRIILQQIKDKKIIHNDLIYPDEAIDWFSEALLPTPFYARTRDDKLYETSTHADGVIGKFEIGKHNIGDLTLKDFCDFFYITEAKMYSKLSAGTKNAENYNQAARNIACIAQLIYENETIKIDNFKKLGFYVLLPEEQLKEEPSFRNFMDKENIKSSIIKRISLYPADEIKNREIFYWINVNINKFMDKIDVKLITWEDLIQKTNDNSVNEFYSKCKKYNKRIKKGIY